MESCRKLILKKLVEGACEALRDVDAPPGHLLEEDTGEPLVVPYLGGVDDTGHLHLALGYHLGHDAARERRCAGHGREVLLGVVEVHELVGVGRRLAVLLSADDDALADGVTLARLVLQPLLTQCVPELKRRHLSALHLDGLRVHEV